MAIDGPQFSTRAESKLYRQWGGEVIGMTGMPEARLAREAELPYAMLAMVTDYDCWREGDEVGVQDVLSVMRGNVSIARHALTLLARGLPPDRTAVPADTALDGAIMTAPAQRDRELMARLSAIAGRALR
jgi:5'-methylthioadenosine phosphorylase